MKRGRHPHLCLVRQVGLRAAASTRKRMKFHEIKNKARCGTRQDSTGGEEETRTFLCVGRGEVGLRCIDKHKTTNETIKKIEGRCSITKGRGKRSQGGEATETFVLGEESVRCFTTQNKKKESNKIIGAKERLKKGKPNSTRRRGHTHLGLELARDFSNDKKQRTKVKRQNTR